MTCNKSQKSIKAIHVLYYLTMFLLRRRRQKCNNMYYFLASYVKSSQGNTHLCVEGYTFCAKRTIGLKMTWVCSSHNNKGCRAMVVTIDNEIIKLNNNHNHGKSKHKSYL